ncbi:MAG: hypothetical protein J6A21_10230 [Lentisphaeria bacterium]|nr:hypothetical protein [Lentisphaeria bacterium]
MFRTDEKQDISPLPGNGKNAFREALVFALAFLLPVVLLCLLRVKCFSLHGGEPGTDGFYHAAMALRGPEVFAAKKFPFLAFSLWKETFADKELLYHILLRGILLLQKAVTGATYPFTFPAMAFCSGALFAFLLLLKSLKVSGKKLLLCSILFSFCAFAFTYRFLMLRPHVFSMMFLFLACALFSAPVPGGFPGRLAGFFLLGFLYAWSYSNPHFLLLPMLFYAFFARKELSRKGLLFPAVVFAGLLAGYVFHPQFPNTFAVWKVQSLDAVLSPLFYGRRLASKLPPMEMMPGNFAWFRNALPFYALCYTSLYLFIRLREKERREKTELFTPQEKTVLALSLLFTLGTFFVLRAIEYALPFAVASFGVLLSRSEEEKSGFFAWKSSPGKVFALLGAAALCFLALDAHLMLKSNFNHKVPRKVAEFLEKHTPEGALVVNLDWGDFPAMFYANCRNTQLWGMDPAFSYAVSPATARKLENLVLNSIRSVGADDSFHALTGADYAFVLSRREKFVRYLKECSWKAVYESEEGSVFALGKTFPPSTETEKENLQQGKASK